MFTTKEIESKIIKVNMMQARLFSSNCGERVSEALALLASYLESAELELQVLLFVE